MMNRIAFMVMALMTAGMCMAGNVKVLKTEYAGMDVAQEGPYVTVNVKMQVSNVQKEEIACFALLNNGQWDGDNMTIEELVSLTEMMCEGEIELDPVTGTKTIIVPIDVLLDAKLLTGKEKTFYLKTFVVDMKKEAIVGQSPMISFVPNPKESMAKKQQSVNSQIMQMATKNLGPNKSKTQGETKRVSVTCPDCHGTGRINNSQGSTDCDRCDGDGKITKIQKAPGDQNVFDLLNPVLGY